MEKYKGTLVKLINISNMSEVQGTFEGFDTENFILSDSIIVVNRAVADLASTFNEIIQYKYKGDQYGSTIASPLGPLFKNSDDKSIVYLNRAGWVFVPLVDIETMKVDEKDYDQNKQMAIKLIKSMTDYIKSVQTQFMEIADYFENDFKQEEIDEKE